MIVSLAEPRWVGLEAKQMVTSIFCHNKLMFRRRPGQLHGQSVLLIGDNVRCKEI